MGREARQGRRVQCARTGAVCDPHGQKTLSGPTRSLCIITSVSICDCLHAVQLWWTIVVYSISWDAMFLQMSYTKKVSIGRCPAVS
eukprot:1157650-Pelagomonas_calceolata.AAC.8